MNSVCVPLGHKTIGIKRFALAAWSTECEDEVHSTWRMSAMACCHALVRGAERENRDAAKGEAPFCLQPSSDLQAVTHGADRDGRWLDHRSYFHDLLFGVELFSSRDVASVVAFRTTQLLSVRSL